MSMSMPPAGAGAGVVGLVAGFLACANAGVGNSMNAAATKMSQYRACFIENPFWFANA
jgi:hypothetical protein